MVTAITAQNTRGVRRIHFPSPEMVADQIDAVLEDFDVAAVKIGMLGSAQIAAVVANALPAPHPDPLPKERLQGRPSLDGLWGDGAKPFSLGEKVDARSAAGREPSSSTIP